MSAPLLPGLFDAVPDALVVVDAAGRIVQANRQAERLFDFPAGGLAGLGVEALVPAAARQRHRRHRAAYMAAPRVRPMGEAGMALFGQRRSGEQFPVEIALSPLPAADAPLFLASIRDVSESLRVRQALARARYDAVVARIGRLALEAGDADPLPAVPGLLADGLDLAGVLLAFETEDGRLVLHAAGEECPEPDDGTTWPDAWRGLTALRVLPGGSGLQAASPPGATALVPLLDGGCPTGLLAARARPGRDFGGDVLHALESSATLVVAVLQRRRSEARLAHAQRLEALGQLTGGIAHDFNNLLTVLSGNLQLIRMEAGDDARLAPLLDSALDSAARGAGLTAKLLSFARRQRLAPQVVAIGPFLAGFAALLVRTLGPAVEVEQRGPAADLRVRVDRSQLEAALLNLALNARDAMAGGGRLALLADSRWLGPRDGFGDVAPGRYLLVEVADTGAGMAADVATRAVEPFFTTKGPGRGSGLGLSMVYGFARQSGGGLRIDSAPGRGTTVGLCLPLHAGPAGPAPAPAPGRPARRGRGEHVLVVDDDAAVRAATAGLLRTLGYRPMTAADADEALRLLATPPRPRVVLTDVMLGPGPDGVALARRIRADHAGMAVLLTSGHPLDDDASAGLPLLAKPYDRDALAAAVAGALGPGRHAAP